VWLFVYSFEIWAIIEQIGRSHEREKCLLSSSCPSVLCLPVCPYQHGSRLTDFCEFWYWRLYAYLSRISKFCWNRTKLWENLHKDLSRFYSWRWNKFTIKAFLCNAQYCYIVDTQQYTETTRCYSSIAQMLPYTTLPTLFYEIFIYCPKCFGFTDIFKYENNLVGWFLSPLK